MHAVLASHLHRCACVIAGMSDWSNNLSVYTVMSHILQLPLNLLPGQYCTC